MIEIKKRKENNFSISHAEQHHRKKGKDKNKRKQKNSFKDVEFLENNSHATGNYYSNNGHDMREIHERLLNGEEIKIFDLSMARKILKNKNIYNRVGTYEFPGYILEIISYIDNKNVFLIRKG